MFINRKNVLFSGLCLFALTGCGEQKIDPNKYSGLAVNSKWNVSDTCMTARKFLKDTNRISKFKIDELYKTKCTIQSLDGSLLGKFSHNKPFVASWPNGVAARVFADDNNSLRMMGYSSSGIPESWGVVK